MISAEWIFNDFQKKGGLSKIDSNSTDLCVQFYMEVLCKAIKAFKALYSRSRLSTGEP